MIVQVLNILGVNLSKDYTGKKRKASVITKMPYDLEFDATYA